MQRLPLSSPAHAAALVAVGFPRAALKLEALHHTVTGEQRLGWFFESPQAGDAADLLARSRPDHIKPLWRENPAHPFLAAMAGAANLAAFQAWREKPLHVPAFTFHAGRRLLLLHPPDHVPPDQGAQIFSGRRAFFQTYDAAVSAALITAGFVPPPQFTGSGALTFPETSHLFPELTARHAMEASLAMLDPVPRAPLHLPGPFPAGQHPFQFAFAAAGNLLTAPAAAAEARKKPTHFFRGQKSALANDAALKRQGFEDKIVAHVAGV